MTPARHFAYTGHLPDTVLARDYGVSRDRVRRYRISIGVPAIPRKPSPRLDKVVNAVAFLGTARPCQVADFLGARSRRERSGVYSLMRKGVGTGRLCEVGGEYSLGQLDGHAQSR